MGVDGVLFDIDDTLIDTRGAFGHALAGIAREYLPDLPPERDPELVAAWRADEGGHFAAYARGEVGYIEQRQARASALHERFGGPALDTAGFAQWNATFETGFSDAWAALDDVESVLDTLLEAGLAVGALSNAGSEYQASKLERAGLLGRVPMLVGVDTLGFGKPDPRVFVEACRRLGTDPERTAYVGDDLHLDAIAARSAGLVGIWVDRPGARRLSIADSEIAAADVVVIESLDQLPQALGL